MHDDGIPDGITNINVDTESWAGPVVFSPAEESGARLPFQEEQDRPSLPKGVDPADPEPLTRSNAYTLELLKETSERSDFSINPGVGFGLAEATH